MAAPATLTLEKAWARLMRTYSPGNTSLVARNKIIVRTLRSEQRRGK